MTGTERFAIVTGIIGLVANVITLIGFVVGFVEVPSSTAFWAKPSFISFFSLFFLVFCTILLGLGVIHKVKRRSSSVSKWGLAADERRFGAFALLMSLVWVPVYVLWLFAVIEINQLFLSNKLDPNSNGERLVMMLSFFALPFGGLAIAGACAALDFLFSPD